MSGQSEVARLRQQLELQCAGLEAGLRGLASVARHEVVRHRYTAIGQTEKELAALIGAEAATKTVCEVYNRTLQ